MIVVGGGIAGLSAAAELAERGVTVTVLESLPQLGGRVRSWPVELADGTPATMSRGFHAFFRQYYQLRALLRRGDPELNGLRAVEDYPLRHAAGQTDSFTRVPRTPPLNVLGFVLGSPSFPLRRLPQVDAERAMRLLDVEFPATFSDYDGISAAELLDRLRFPDECRHLALEVFARSFFADAEEFSAGELVAMFHSYFLGSAEGLLFDVAADDFDRALWAPLAQWLTQQGAQLRTDTPVRSIELADRGVRVGIDGQTLSADAVVIATDLQATRSLIDTGGFDQRGFDQRGFDQRGFDQRGFDQQWVDSVGALQTAPEFAVWRRWFDTGVRADAADFLGTTGYGPLDNVSMIHQFESGAADWAATNGGSVVELHAYALPAGFDHEQLRAELDRHLWSLHPELRHARTLGDQWLVRADCPLPGLTPWHERPGVVTPSSRVVLAGDGVRCPYPVALMERAATTGVMAANRLLENWGVAGADIWTTPTSPRAAWIQPVHRLLQRTTKESNV
ncbi:isorenieratene synthase [Naumannella halotolerans]|uniref:Isorenieratene synthase n=1 Tax=Naumannella halotolerans TaxID=993414 RepID=A0A4R7JCL7_9ACTN|nr:isorenieratene synthase [Naumannella halotolerans]